MQSAKSFCKDSSLFDLNIFTNFMIFVQLKYAYKTVEYSLS